MWIRPKKKLLSLHLGKNLRVTKLKKIDGPNVRELKAVDLVDGLDLTSETQYRAHASFLEALEKLIQFDFMYWTCSRQSIQYQISNKGNQNKGNYYDAVQYFTGRSNNRLLYTSTDREHSEPFSLFDPVPLDGMLSDADVPVEERPFNFVIKGDKNLIFTDSTKQCYGNNGDWDWFALTVK